MSVKLLSAVWEDQAIKNKSELLVLLAIADHSNDKGIAYPGIERIALKARCSQRAVQRIISGLVAREKLSVEYNAGPYKTNIYRILSATPSKCHPDNSGSEIGSEIDSKNVPEMSPNPSLTIRNHQESSGIGSSQQSFEGLATDSQKSESNSKAQSPKLPSKPKGNPDHQKFIAQWMEAFLKVHGVKYLFAAGADGKAVQTLLSTKLPVSDLIQLAVAAWKGDDQFLAKTCSTIRGFASRFNEVRVVVNGSVKANPSVNRFNSQMQPQPKDWRTMTEAEIIAHSRG